MRKLILTLTSFLIFISLVFPKSRTSQEALQLVNSFINKSNSSIQKAPASVRPLHLVYTSFEKQDFPTSANKPYYFVYNIGENNGFIIVSGDDRAKGILGYSDSGSFDMNTLPDNLKYWLRCYENELKPLLNYPDSLSLMTTVQSNAPKRVSSFTTTVSPLTTAIKWNQDAPYNNYCPVINAGTGERAVTGCVATAMAQVMKYYNWPVHGTGSNSYTTNTKKIALSVDFSQTQYDWANMTGTYSSTSTNLQDSAVATLMYHCGVAVKMDYNQSSSAYSTDMARALINNFGYDQNIQYLLRDYYTRSEWIALLKTELNASRPVLYAGQASDGGHQFVCDGYDSNDFFHFNWGWGGASNGYFELSALNPNDQGIGSSSGGYNSDQAIVTGIQKPSNTSTPHYTITTNQPITSSAGSVSRTATFSITAKEIYNMGINTFGGSIGVALYNDNGFVQVLKYSNVSSLPSYSGWATITTSSVTIPTAVSDGTYKLYYVYKATAESVWQIVRGKVGTANFLNVTTSSTNITFSSPTNVLPQLTVNSINVTGNVYQNKTGRFSVNITNTGGEYNSAIELYLKSSVDQSITNVLTENVNIASGETKTIYMYDSVKVVPGQYVLSVMYDPLNRSLSSATLTPVSNVINVSVLAEPTGEPALTLSTAIAFPNQTNVDRNNSTLTAVIKNTGGYFENKLIAFIFPVSGGSSLTYIGYQDAMIDTNEESTITFSGPIILDPNQYKIAVYYLNSSNAWTKLLPQNNSSLTFTLTDNISSVVDHQYSNDVQLYPNPTSDILYLKSDERVSTIRISDLSGKQLQILYPDRDGEIPVPVVNLSPGTYILRMETDNAVKTAKFIKK